MVGTITTVTIHITRANNKMMFLNRLIIALIITTAALQAHAGNHGKQSFWTGIAESKIEPSRAEASASCLGGYGPPFARCSSLEIADTITVRALAISSAGNNIYMLSVDTIGMGDQVISRIQKRAKQLSRSNIKPKEIVVISTHAHSTPDLQGLWGGVDPSYRERIIETSARAIVNAKKTQVLTSIEALAFDSEELLRNRRGGATVDQEIRALSFFAVNGGQRVATLFNVSAHPTILDQNNSQYSSGWIHSAREELDRELGGKTIFVNGALGDVEPVVDGRDYPDAQEWGLKIANTIIQRIDESTSVRGRLKYKRYNFSHPVTNPLVLGAAQAGLLDIDIIGTQEPSIKTTFSVMNIGDTLSIVFFPGEALSGIALPILEASNAEYTFFVGLAGASYGYFIPSEEYLTVPGRTTEEAASLDPLIGDAIQAAILRKINR